jgi:hypothetical protein
MGVSLESWRRNRDDVGADGKLGDRIIPGVTGLRGKNHSGFRVLSFDGRSGDNGAGRIVNSTGNGSAASLPEYGQADKE